MNAKTYGQVLRNELNARVEGLRLSIADTNALEKVAQSLLLEFVRRVEEREDTTPEPDDYYGNEGFYSHKLLADAFRKLSTELKEAK